MRRRRPRGHGECPENGKTQFARGDAELLARIMRRRDHVPVQAFACTWCSWWHVGHPSEGRRRRRRQAPI